MVRAEGVTDADPVVVFDLDGVLTRRDTLTALILRAALRSPWRLVRLPGALIAVVRHGQDVPRRATAVARLVAVLFAGRGAAEVDAWCEQVGTRAVASRRWARPELLAEYRRLQQDGNRVVVATATEERVARAVLRAAGLESEAVHGSRITTSDEGAELVVYNYGPRKLRSLQEGPYDLTRATFYTDSRSDLPVASVARRTVLVAPSRATLEAVATAGLGARIHVWSAADRVTAAPSGATRGRGVG